MAAEDPVGGGPAGGRQVELAAFGLGDEPVGDEPAEHLAGRLGGDAEVAGDLRRGDPRAVAGHHPQREQVLLGGRGEVAWIVAARHDRQDTGRRRTRAADPADDGDRQTRRARR